MVGFGFVFLRLKISSYFLKLKISGYNYDKSSLAADMVFGRMKFRLNQNFDSISLVYFGSRGTRDSGSG